jgi:hypothetical protein
MMSTQQRRQRVAYVLACRGFDELAARLRADEPAATPAEPARPAEDSWVGRLSQRIMSARHR